MGFAALFSTAVEDSAGVVGYFALFGALGLAFVFVNLLIGRFVRPHDPHDEKLEIYECGEPTIGSSFVQFDLRFYVLALIFIIFDVEVAFLFPWATVFGKTTNLAGYEQPLVQTDGAGVALSSTGHDVLREMGIRNPTAPAVGDAAGAEAILRDSISTFAKLATCEVLVFFLVLLVGYAYVWKTGALDWIRVVAPRRPLEMERPVADLKAAQESVLSA
jgi:NADH-quinone oxidoreductase subunit A